MLDGFITITNWWSLWESKKGVICSIWDFFAADLLAWHISYFIIPIRCTGILRIPALLTRAIGVRERIFRGRILLKTTLPQYKFGFDSRMLVQFKIYGYSSIYEVLLVFFNIETCLSSESLLASWSCQSKYSWHFLSSRQRVLSLAHGRSDRGVTADSHSLLDVGQ